MTRLKVRKFDLNEDVEDVIAFEQHKGHSSSTSESLRPFAYEDRLELDWLTAKYEQSTQDVIGGYRNRYLHISREER